MCFDEDVFLKCAMIGDTGQVMVKAVFTVTLVRLFFLEHHFSGSLECSDMLLFLSET